MSTLGLQQLIFTYPTWLFFCPGKINKISPPRGPRIDLLWEHALFQSFFNTYQLSPPISLYILFFFLFTPRGNRTTVFFSMVQELYHLYPPFFAAFVTLLDICVLVALTKTFLNPIELFSPFSTGLEFWLDDASTRQRLMVKVGSFVSKNWWKALAFK